MSESLFHDRFRPDKETVRREVLVALATSPLSSDEMRVTTNFLREMEADGLVKIDPDPWPDEYVPGNPLVARLPDDTRSWPGWKKYGWRR